MRAKRRFRPECLIPAIARHSVTVCLLLVSVMNVAPAQTSLRERTFSASLSVPESTSVDLVTQEGHAILLTGQATNIALKKRINVRYGSTDTKLISTNPNSSITKLVDGIVAAGNFFELRAGQEGTQILIDLGAVRLVNHIITRTNISSAKDFRMRGYSLYLGLDSLSMYRVKIVPENDTTVTDDLFNPDTARYVMIQIDKMDRSGDASYSTILGEIQVFGIGCLTGGMYTSTVRDLGMTSNVGRARWWGVFPTGTKAQIQLRTGNSSSVDATWSPWSSEVAMQDSLPEVYENRRFLQYRMTLYTDYLDTPRLDSVEIDYDQLVVAATTSAEISPRSVEILEPAEIRYAITVTFDARSRGIDSLVFLTAIPIVPTDVTLDGAPIAFSRQSTPGRIVIGFGSTITSGSVITAHLKFTPVLLINRIPSQFISKQTPENPQRVDAAIVGGVEGWTIVTTGIPNALIAATTADPNPFTPNGDGLNDISHISFVVTNLLEPKRFRVTVHDITGRAVRRLLEVHTSAKAFVEQDALQFDGRDDHGRMLPPGLYIYQLILDADGVEPAVVTKTITIAY